jgi:drug/metabolite transporter (DMT)-like permease
MRLPGYVAVIALTLALCSSVTWGLGDFLGGLQSRRLPLLNVLVGSQLAGLIAISTFVALDGSTPPRLEFVAFAVLSGLAGVVGLASFYRGLAIGNMGVVAPISSTAAVIPLVIGIASGDRPSALASIGLTLALAGVALASREEVGRDQIRGQMAKGTAFAILSAVGFGFFFAAMDRASDGGVQWAIFVNRVTGVSLLLGAALVLRPPIAVTRRDVPLLGAIGALDISANGMFAVASTKGLISLVAVVGSLYPLTTIALARAVLGERPNRVARLGVAAALGGVILIAAG